MKNKGLKKMVAFGMMMTMLFSTGLVANAAKTSWKTSHKFNSKWELTKTWVTDSADPGFVLSCAYGFDTFLVNEDYVTSCKSTLLSHEAAVKNSNGKSVCTGLYRPGYTSSKADVKHTGANVTYYMATAAVLD